MKYLDIFFSSILGILGLFVAIIAYKVSDPKIMAFALMLSSLGSMVLLKRLLAIHLK